ncbi:serpin-ZXA [Cinnamomum micranthum f. kanehirae]|uniref:Serpin-ZXA n=1 Tax=Cinnamomum micranthum f. kanehirae TaxID=337451 RepID=A0A443NFL3_9MAGN|nr:serpin-ZXA [Cinnamomum micranthum f. kanehirae]
MQFVCSFKDFQVIKLHYRRGQEGRQLSMYIFLPEKRNGLPNLVKKLSSDSGFLNSFNYYFTRVAVRDFSLPRFKFSFGFEASTFMKELGLVLPFSNVVEFTEMVEQSHGPFVSEIQHSHVLR